MMVVNLFTKMGTYQAGHLVQLKSGDDTQGQGGIAEVNSHLFSPLEAAYQANKVVSEVWSSPQSGVTSLYRQIPRLGP